MAQHAHPVALKACSHNSSFNTTNSSISSFFAIFFPALKSMGKYSLGVVSKNSSTYFQITLFINKMDTDARSNVSDSFSITLSCHVQYQRKMSRKFLIVIEIMQITCFSLSDKIHCRIRLKMAPKQTVESPERTTKKSLKTDVIETRLWSTFVSYIE